MLHGWGGIQDALTVSYYEEFTRAGYAVMTFDYRGWAIVPACRDTSFPPASG